MLMLFMHPIRRFMRVVGACAFMSLVVACTAHDVEKFGAAATPPDDAGACAFMSADACAPADRAATVAVARAAPAATAKTAATPR